MRARFLAGLLLLLFWSGPATAAPRAPLIVISIDGFRADYLARGQTPTLAMLARRGVHAPMHPSFPSLTYPNHYTLVTGLYPDHHGIVENTMRDSAVSSALFTMKALSAEDPRWWDGAAPLWASAQAQGLVTASAGWPGSEGLIHGRRPDYEDPWRPERPEGEIAAVALNWLDLPAAWRPAIMFLYFDAVDEAGHAHGPDSSAVNAAMHRVDAAIGTLVEGLARRHIAANIVVVSDHGMTATDNAHVETIDDWVRPAAAALVDQGVLAGFNPLPGHAVEAERALIGRHGHARCWRKQDIPARLHYGRNPRVPAIVCLADPGWQILTRAALAGRKIEVQGQHGYDPADPDMNALFVAAGPAFRHGVALPAFDNVDVYPLLAHVAGVTPMPNDGHLSDLAAALK